MGGYVGRRLLLAVVTLMGLSILIFVLAAVVGDPSEVLATASTPEASATPEQVEASRRALGLDRPMPDRYASWLGKALKGDFGESLFTSRSVAEEIRRALPATLLLALVALMLIVVLAVPMGVAGALFHRRWPDHLVRLAALLGASVPAFFLAYVLVYVFAVRLHLLPVSGFTEPKSVVLPAFALAVGPAATVSRLLRAALLDVLGEPYMLAARGKGLSGVPVLFGHGVRNAALPVLTVLGGTLARMLEGAVLLETVFAWPGMGLLAYNGIISYDYPVVVGTVMFAGVIFIVLNLLVDLSYGLVDPRVRLGAVT